MGLQLLEREKAVFQDQKEANPDFSGKEYILERQLNRRRVKDIIEELAPSRSKTDCHDGYFGRTFFRAVAYLLTKRYRLPRL